MVEKNIVVVGAGVAGLTTAMLLSENPCYTITVAAKHMPGDYDIEYASPWAGADYMPSSSVEGTDSARWEADTWPPLRNLAENHPDAGIVFRRQEIHFRVKDLGSPISKWPAEGPWWKHVFSDFREIPKSELGPDIDNASTFTSVCINTAIYLPWLVSQCLKAGVVFKRANFRNISDAATFHHSGSSADLLVNCTGLSSLKLGGVEDKSMVPVRGQIVVVRNDPEIIMSISGCDDGPEEGGYLMARAAGGGTVLGGCFQKGNWESQVDSSLALRIMKRCVDLCPQLTGGKGIEHLDIIRHGVGLRPFREGGPRVEKERIDGIWVVHNYGHGGAGYQMSYACAQDAVKLVDEV